MRRSLALLLLVLPLSLTMPSAGAFGQVGNPTDFSNNPHPGMPWSPTMSQAYGRLVRYVPVPPKQMVIDVAVPTPPGVPPQTRQQVVQVPGYNVAQTTTGFYYPERWTIERLNVGVYQWRKLPAEFRRK